MPRTTPDSPQTRRYGRSVLAPLRARESATALSAAIRAVESSTDTPSERLRAHPPELRIEKPPRRDAAPTRLIRVVVRDRDLHIDHDVAVTPDGQIAEQVQRTDTRRPLTPDEREQIDSLLAHHERTARLIRMKNVAVEIASPTDHDAGRRVAARILRTQRGRVTPVATAEIDLDGPFVVGVSDVGEETR